MDEGTTGLLILGACALAAALASHAIVKRYWMACLLAAVAGDAAFQAAVYVYSGELDPFFAIALIVGFGVCFAVAAVVGIPFAWSRRVRPAI